MPVRRVVLIVIAALVLVAGVELAMGRQLLGPDGRFGWWEGNIWSGEQSQRFADPYSLTHIEHGLLYYAVLWLVARRASSSSRFLGAIALEAGGEILENSPIIIDRYRAVTISLGYVGDSVLNSLSDVLMMAIGFWFAATRGVATSVGLVVGTEAGMALLFRDNLLLNIVMLIHPVAALRTWQMAAAPR